MQSCHVCQISLLANEEESIYGRSDARIEDPDWLLSAKSRPGLAETSTTGLANLLGERPYGTPVRNRLISEPDDLSGEAHGGPAQDQRVYGYSGAHSEP